MKLPIDLRAGQSGHPRMHIEERTRLNALCILPGPVGTAAQNSAAIAAAIASVTDASGNMGTVTLGPGVWALDGAVGIELRGKFGGVLQGVGDATILRWTGNADGVVIAIAKSQQTTVRNLRIEATSAAACAVLFTRDGGAGYAPTKNILERVRIDGSANRRFIDAVRISGIDANNDFHICREVYATGYTRAGFMLGGSQSYNNVFYDCHAWGPAEYGLLQTWIGSNSATFQWRGGSTFGHTVADFSLIRNAYAPVSIEGVNSEGSECFVKMAVTTSFATLMLNGNRWSGAGSVNHIALDLAGRILGTVTHNHLGDGLNPTAATTIRYVPASLSHVRFEGNIVFSTAAAVFTDSVPETVLGNIKANEITLAMVELTA